MTNSIRYLLSFLTGFFISYALVGVCLSLGWSPFIGLVASVVISVRLNQYIREGESV